MMLDMYDFHSRLKNPQNWPWQLPKQTLKQITDVIDCQVNLCWFHFVPGQKFCPVIAKKIEIIKRLWQLLAEATIVEF